MDAPDAIRRSIAILVTHRAMLGQKRGTGAAVSEKKARQVIETIEAQRARWVLVGAHAIGIMTEPRATEDFDFVVQGDKLEAVLVALRERFGTLGEQDIGVAVRLKKIDIDLIRSTSHPL